MFNIFSSVVLLLVEFEMIEMSLAENGFSKFEWAEND
jgi:hypothetical protein